MTSEEKNTSILILFGQGYGKHLWIMQGMFKANGGCGYVKKPDFLLQRGENDEVFNPNAPLAVATVMKVLDLLITAPLGSFTILILPYVFLYR